jgi:hypothetical protein
VFKVTAVIVNTIMKASNITLKTSIVSIGIEYTKSFKYLPPQEEVAGKFSGLEENFRTLHHTPTQYLNAVQKLKKPHTFFMTFPRDIFIFHGGNKGLRIHKFVLSVSNFLKTFVISTEM